jgi:hypothetical protein
MTPLIKYSDRINLLKHGGKVFTAMLNTKISDFAHTVVYSSISIICLYIVAIQGQVSRPDLSPEIVQDLAVLASSPYGVT